MSHIKQKKFFQKYAHFGSFEVSFLSIYASKKCFLDFFKVIELFRIVWALISAEKLLFFVGIFSAENWHILDFFNVIELFRIVWALILAEKVLFFVGIFSAENWHMTPEFEIFVHKFAHYRCFDVSFLTSLGVKNWFYGIFQSSWGAVLDVLGIMFYIKRPSICCIFSSKG